jgi:hypothetical protein
MAVNPLVFSHQLNTPRQLQRSAKSVIDTCLPAFTRGTQRSEYIRIQANFHGLFGRFRLGTATPPELVAFIKIR